MSKRDELARKRAALAQRREGLSPDNRTRLAERLNRRATSEDFIPRRVEGGPPPASHSQEFLWRYQQLHPQNTAYNMPLATRILGPLNLDGVRWALSRLQDRHQILRTNFKMEDGQLVQLIHDRPHLQLPTHDLTALTAQQQEAALKAEVEQSARLPFDLGQDPLLRMSLLILGPEDHCLVRCMHHIIADGWSMGVFMQETAALYYSFVNSTDLGIPPKDLPPMMIQFADYAAWQRKQLSGDALEKLMGWWQAEFPKQSSALALPLDYPRGNRQTFHGDTLGAVLAPPDVKALEALARAEHASAYMVMLAACHYLLHAYSHQSQIVTGTWCANRERPEVAGLIGLFAELMPLWTSFEQITPAHSFRDLLRLVRTNALAAFSHQGLPMLKIMEATGNVFEEACSPLFRVLCVFQNWPTPKIEATDVTMEHVTFTRDESRFDLSFVLHQFGDTLHLALEYNADLFAAETANMILHHYATLLTLACADADRALAQLVFAKEEERIRLNLPS